MTLKTSLSGRSTCSNSMSLLMAKSGTGYAIRRRLSWRKENALGPHQSFGSLAPAGFIKNAFIIITADGIWSPDATAQRVMTNSTGRAAVKCPEFHCRADGRPEKMPMMAAPSTWGRAHKKCYTTSPRLWPRKTKNGNEKLKAAGAREARNLYAFWSGSGNDSCGNKGTRECRKYCASDHNNAMKRLARGKVRKTGGKQKTKETHSIFAPFQFPTRVNHLIHLLLVTAGRPLQSSP